MVCPSQRVVAVVQLVSALGADAFYALVAAAFVVVEARGCTGWWLRGWHPLSISVPSYQRRARAVGALRFAV